MNIILLILGAIALTLFILVQLKKAENERKMAELEQLIDEEAKALNLNLPKLAGSRLSMNHRLYMTEHYAKMIYFARQAKK